MSSSSKQKESKQPFEQQLSYISAFFIRWLNTKLEQCDFLH